MNKLMSLMMLSASAVFVSAVMISTAALANPPVSTVPVTTENNALSFYSSGLVTNKAQSRLSFKTSGIVEKLTVNDGMRVTKGQLLAQLDLSEIKAQKNQAQADFKQATLDVDRLTKLVKQRLAPKEKLDNALIRLDKAKAALNIAQFNLKHSQIKAPANGIVIIKHIEQNELVSPGQPVLTFSPDSKGWVVKAGLIDREAVHINLGDRTTIQLDAYPGYTLEGTVTEMAAQANANTGLFEIEVNIEEEQLRLMSGLYAHVQVHPVQQPVLYRIPTSSLLKANGKTGTVAQINPLSRNIELKTVQVHSLSTSSVLVSSGLDQSWPVVTGSPYNLLSRANDLQQKDNQQANNQHTELSGL